MLYLNQIYPFKIYALYMEIWFGSDRKYQNQKQMKNFHLEIVQTIIKQVNFNFSSIGLGFFFNFCNVTLFY